jgi:hypothetical protein
MAHARSPGRHARRSRWLRASTSAALALGLGLLLTLTSSCRRPPPPKAGGLAASGSDDGPKPVEEVYQPLPPMDIGVLKDEEETSCAEGLVPRIRDATTALGRFWILDTDGHLWSFDRALEHRQLHLVDKVVDVIRRAEDGSLWAVVNEANRWRVVWRDASGWHHLADLPAALWNDDALVDRGGRPVVTTRERRTFWFDAAGLVHLWTAPLPPRWEFGRTSAVATSDGTIYVAHDAGEFDGSLEWIHVGGPGRPTTREAVLRGPMTDVVVDPTDRRCVIASEGLVHGISCRGRVVRSCPGDVSVVVELQDTQCRAEWQNSALEKVRQTVAFSKIIANRATIYALGEDETYAITGRVARRLPPPLFADHCGLSVAHVEGLTFIRDPRVGKQYRDVIDFRQFAVPAL